MNNPVFKKRTTAKKIAKVGGNTIKPKQSTPAQTLERDRITQLENIISEKIKIINRQSLEIKTLETLQKRHDKALYQLTIQYQAYPHLVDSLRNELKALKLHNAKLSERVCLEERNSRDLHSELVNFREKFRNCSTKLHHHHHSITGGGGAAGDTNRVEQCEKEQATSHTVHYEPFPDNDTSSLKKAVILTPEPEQPHGVKSSTTPFKLNTVNDNLDLHKPDIHLPVISEHQIVQNSIVQDIHEKQDVLLAAKRLEANKPTDQQLHSQATVTPVKSPAVKPIHIPNKPGDSNVKPVQSIFKPNFKISASEGYHSTAVHDNKSPSKMIHEQTTINTLSMQNGRGDGHVPKSGVPASTSPAQPIFLTPSNVTRERDSKEAKREVEQDMGSSLNTPPIFLSDSKPGHTTPKVLSFAPSRPVLVPDQGYSPSFSLTTAPRAGRRHIV